MKASTSAFLLPRLAGCRVMIPRHCNGALVNTFASSYRFSRKLEDKAQNGIKPSASIAYLVYNSFSSQWQSSIATDFFMRLGMLESVNKAILRCQVNVYQIFKSSLSQKCYWCCTGTIPSSLSLRVQFYNGNLAMSTALNSCDAKHEGSSSPSACKLCTAHSWQNSTNLYAFGLYFYIAVGFSFFYSKSFIWTDASKPSP